ncbi:MAG TPA: hypothetical protein ENG14_01350 [Thermodesulforhabdus norvegica]|uniref:Uncharacterized protein n=1 Tax=Thermodesulforhabdus norvegica TaxID=39841 RepID=A0A7C0WSG8_9BACT|nr:hypothetical protein [Thermodesulforhabdus norvegica]
MYRPMRDLKEAVAKIATQTWCEPLVGLEGRAWYRGLLKPNILYVTRPGIGGGWAMTKLSILPGEWPSMLERCNCDSVS